MNKNFTQQHLKRENKTRQTLDLFLTLLLAERQLNKLGVLIRRLQHYGGVVYTATFPTSEINCMCSENEHEDKT